MVAVIKHGYEINLVQTKLMLDTREILASVLCRNSSFDTGAKYYSDSLSLI